MKDFFFFFHQLLFVESTSLPLSCIFFFILRGDICTYVQYIGVSAPRRRKKKEAACLDRWPLELCINATIGLEEL